MPEPTPAKTTRKRVVSKPEPVSETVTAERGSIPQHDDKVAPDIEHKYGKSGGKTRTFTLLSGPTQAVGEEFAKYTLHEVNKDGNTIEIEGRFTAPEVDAFVLKNGQWLA